MSCLITFRIKTKADLGENETIRIVGNVKELGDWEIENSLPLKSSASNVFTCQVRVPVNCNVIYRYFIARNAVKNGKEVLLLQSNESSVNPRTLTTVMYTNLNVDDGFYGEVDGKECLNNGFLSGQSELRISMSSPIDHPFVQFNKSFLSKNSCGLKNLYVKPVSTCSHLSEKFIRNIPLGYNLIEDSPLKCVEIPKDENSHLTYVLQHLHAEEISVKLEIYSGDDSHTAKLLGVGIVAVSCLPTTCTILKIALFDIGQHACIGLLRVPCLLIRTYPHPLSIKENYSNYWKWGKMIHCGHRGSGNSFTSEKIANRYENTIDSLCHAGANGGEFVEFDVQLTQDGVPVIYHDLATCVPVEQRAKKDVHLVKTPVCLMNLQHVQELRMRQKSERDSTKTLDYDRDDLDPAKQPFPTLQQVFEQVPIEVGFNVEVKYPALDHKGNYEDGLKYFIDPNFYCDAILKVIFQYAGKRKIIFSCFEVNICIMLRRKQTKYPVLFLTNGDTDHYQPMLDLRERTNEMAIGVAMSEGLLGINSLCLDVYKTPEIVEKAHQADLVFACYGDDVCDNLKKIKDTKVDIAIYDRIYEQHMEKK